MSVAEHKWLNCEVVRLFFFYEITYVPEVWELCRSHNDVLFFVRLGKQTVSLSHDHAVSQVLSDLTKWHPLTISC